MKLYLSNIKNKDKPNSYKIKKISNTILNNLVDISLEEFAEELAEQGKTVVLAELSDNKLSKTTPIIGQELIMLDFDNKDLKNTYTIDDLECDIFMQNHAVFYYRTFSDLYSEVDKFRVVFQLNEVVESNNEIEEIYQKLFEMYPQADSSVGQTNRMFFGSNSSYELIDSDNRLLVDDLLESDKAEVISFRGEEVIISTDTPIYELLKYKKYDLIKQKLENKYSKSFPDDISASQYYKSIDMKELLEFPEGNPFCDIFHFEDNPSASVFYAEDVNIYLYKCFSQSHPFQGDIIKVLSYYLNLDSFSEAIDLLINITNSEISKTDPVGKAKRNYADLKKQLKYNQLSKNYPELYEYIRRYEREIIELLDIMFDFIYTDKTTGEVRYLNYLSVDKLRQIINKNLHSNISREKMWDILNLVVVTEMITKIPETEIPKSLIDNFLRNQKEVSQQIRISNVYEPSIDLKNTYEIAKLLSENNVKVRSLGFEIVYRLFGEEKAHKDFPQAYKPLEAKGLWI